MKSVRLFCFLLALILSSTGCENKKGAALLYDDHVNCTAEYIKKNRGKVLVEIPEVFVLVNISKKDKQIAVRVKGSRSELFEAYRTTDDRNRYEYLGRYELEDDCLEYKVAAAIFFTK